MNPLGLRTRFATLARLLIVQATFNYRTLIGTGFAFCLVPILKQLHRGDQERFDAVLSRHLGLFNSHPYLAAMAVGAVARMEAEGAEPDAVERFKTAIRGPLGSLGDQLVWATWLPAVVLLSAGTGIALGRPSFAVIAFLVLYNAGHLGLRFWAFTAGLSSGPLVATQIRRANLPRWTSRMTLLLAFAIGLVLGGLVLLAGAGGRPGALGWGVATMLAFGLGSRWGAGAWRVAVSGLIAVILGFAVAGALL